MTVVQGVHLCGSVLLESADVVFRVVGEELGGVVRRIPDGETGERAGWIGWAAMVFWRIDGLEEKYPFYSEVSPRAIGLADGSARTTSSIPTSSTPTRRWPPTIASPSANATARSRPTCASR
jgi:hypothetical protein